MRRAAVAAAALLVLAAGPAEAHRLRVFATVEGSRVEGYGFFTGGGRAAGARVEARDDAGALVHEGVADDEGRFGFAVPPPPPAALTVTVDAGDGHRAAIRLAGERFGAAAPSAPVAAATIAASDAAGAADAADRDATLVAAVEAAVARQIRPVLEAQAAAEARLRVSDVAGGVGIILGMAGAALWAMARRGPGS